MRLLVFFRQHINRFAHNLNILDHSKEENFALYEILFS